MAHEMKAPRLGLLTLPERWRRVRLQAYSWLLTGVYHAAAMNPALWRAVARGYHPVFDRLAALHATVACRLAAVDVPAYRHFLGRRGRTRATVLAEFPETSKLVYAGVYDEASRCQEGKLHRPGVVVDESS